MHVLVSAVHGFWPAVQMALLPCAYQRYPWLISACTGSLQKPYPVQTMASAWRLDYHATPGLSARCGTRKPPVQHPRCTTCRFQCSTQESWPRQSRSRERAYLSMNHVYAPPSGCIYALYIPIHLRYNIPVVPPASTSAAPKNRDRDTGGELARWQRTGISPWALSIAHVLRCTDALCTFPAHYRITTLTRTPQVWGRLPCGACTALWIKHHKLPEFYSNHRHKITSFTN